jgi:hypothetical protein
MIQPSSGSMTPSAAMLGSKRFPVHSAIQVTSKAMFEPQSMFAGPYWYKEVGTRTQMKIV